MRGRKFSSFPYLNGKGFAYITHIILNERTKSEFNEGPEAKEETEQGSLLLSPSLEVATEILEIRYHIVPHMYFIP